MANGKPIIPSPYPIIPSPLQVRGIPNLSQVGTAQLPPTYLSTRAGIPSYTQLPQRVGESVMPSAVLTPQQRAARATANLAKLTQSRGGGSDVMPVTQQRPRGFFDSLPSPMSPAGQALGAFGSTALQLSGYQDRPITLGAGLGAAMQAAQEAYTAGKQREAAAKIDEENLYLNRLKAEAALAKATDKGAGEGYFQSKSFTANKYNTLLSVGQKIKDGTATEEEKLAYRLSYQDLSQPRTETRTTDEGTTTVNVPALDLSAFPTPEGMSPAKEEQIGQVRQKFTDVQGRAASFAVRVKEANNVFDNLIAGGYDPTNPRDQLAEDLGATWGMSTEGQQYDAAKRNFINAQLRRESGAAIAASEFDNANKQYFPQLGDSEAVLKQKRKARETAFRALKAEGGAAYDVLFGQPDEKDAEAKISGLPEGSKLIKTKNGKKYYEAPDKSIYVVE